MFGILYYSVTNCIYGKKSIRYIVVKMHFHTCLIFHATVFNNQNLTSQKNGNIGGIGG